MEDSRSASAEVLFLSGIGEVFPPSLDSVKTLFVGLLGEVRVRGVGCVLLLRRITGRPKRALGGKGTACGEQIEGLKRRLLSEIDRRDGDNGEGENEIEAADGDCDLSIC